MCRESHIVGTHCRLRRNRVARCILSTDERGGVQESVGEEVGQEPEDVDGREVDGSADCGIPAKIKERLRIEGEGPGECAGGRNC